MKYRTEIDSMGEVMVPEDAYYGAQTQRAVDNFSLSGLRFPRSMIKALWLIPCLPLLAAGNWNGDVVANEELELHARLRRAGHRVRYLPAFSVRHYTIVSSPLHELASAYFPIRPDRYGALGMAVRASA